jgi:hypothetical protein
VRFRLKQHCFVFDSNIHVADNAGRRRSNRTSVGIFRDRQSWSELRRSGTYTDRIAQCGFGGTDCGRTDHAHDHVSVRRFVSHDKPVPVPWQHRRSVEHDERLLKTPFIRELDQP